MPYDPPAGEFVDNASPVGGGTGLSLNAEFFTALVAGVDDADTRITAFADQMPVNVRDYGATGNGSTNDTAALEAARDEAVASGRPLYFPAGSYCHTGGYDLRYDGLHAFGDGRHTTFIKITGSNVAGVQLGRYRQHVHDLSVQYATAQGSANTASNGFEFYKASWGTYERLASYDGARSFYIPQVDYEIGPTDTLNNWMFSCDFETMHSIRFSIGGFRLDCYGAKGTGNVFTNIYINNKTTGGARGGCTESAASFQNFSELVVNQFNVEHVAPSAVSATVLLVTCYAPVFNSVHMEGITLGVANAALFRCVDDVRLTVHGFNVSFTTIDSAGGGAKSWFNMGADCHLSLDGGHQESVTVTNPSYSLANFEAGSTTGLVYARAVDVSAFTALGTGDAASITARLREVNDDWDHFTHNQLSAGAETLPRDLISSAGASTSTGNLRLTYFTARKTGSSTQVRLLSGGTAAGATPTLARIGLYEIDATGGGALVASTANDTALFAAASLAYTRSWSTPYTLVAGRRYALGVLVVTAAAAPTLSGIAAGLGSELAIAPRLTGSLGSQTDLPGSFTAGSVATSGSRVYAALI